MRNLIQQRDQIFVKCYGFLSFSKIKDNNFGKGANRNLTRKYSQELFFYDIVHAYNQDKKLNKKQVNAGQTFDMIFLSGYQLLEVKCKDLRIKVIDSHV